MQGVRWLARSATGARLVALTLAGVSLTTMGMLEACSSTSASHGKTETTDAAADARTDVIPVADASDAAKIDATTPQDSSTAVDASAPDATTPPPDAPATDSTVPDSSVDGTVVADATRPQDASDAALDASADVSDGAVVCDPDAGGYPSDLSCTGLYSDWATKTIAPGVQPYTPAYILWSDGAVKQRFIYLPPGTQIDTTNMDDWVFPVGTKIWKQFALNGQLIETRLLWKQPSDSYSIQNGWVAVTYRWAADLSSAPLLLGGETNVNGTTYEIPATYRCINCHGGRQDMVLGFDLIGTGTSMAQGLTLPMLVSGGLVTHPPPASPVVIPNDSTGLAVPALGWLHVNCGVTCHNADPNAMALQTHLYLKLLSAQLYPEGGAAEVANLDTYTTSVNVMSTLTPNGHSYPRIDPGDAGASLLPLMDLSRGADAAFSPMPPIVSHIPDTTDVQAVQNWINAL